MIEKIVAFLSVSFDPNQLRASSFFREHQERLLTISDANDRVAYIFHAVRTKGHGIDLDRISLTNLMKRVHRVASYQKFLLQRRW